MAARRHCSVPATSFCAARMDDRLYQALNGSSAVRVARSPASDAPVKTPPGGRRILGRFQRGLEQGARVPEIAGLPAMPRNARPRRSDYRRRDRAAPARAHDRRARCARRSRAAAGPTASGARAAGVAVSQAPLPVAIVAKKITAVGIVNTVNCWLTTPAASARARHAAISGCLPRSLPRRREAQRAPRRQQQRVPAMPCATSASRNMLCGDSCAKSG